MPRQATVYRVLIASPAGLEDERQAARDTFYDWNASPMSPLMSIMFEPLLCEEHVHPESGERTQLVIDKQIVERSDLVIAIFWDRIGTPTGNFKSGTIEELDNFIQEKKLSMIYFSEKGVNIKEIDTNQIDELADFKKKCMKFSYISTFKNIDEFRRKLTQHIIYIAPKLRNGTFNKENKKNESSYTYKEDRIRLWIQAESLVKLDRENIEGAISNIRGFNLKEEIKVLDVGCASGYVTHSRFNEFEKIQVVGIDKSKAAIEEANRDYADGKFSFTNADIADDHFYPERYDIIFCSFVLHHLAKPESILHKLWSALNPHGCLIVNTVDDGMIINYPQDKDLEELIQKTNELKGSPNRLHGREIYNHLMSLDPVPERVEMKFDVLTTANMSKEDRRNYFLESHSFRVDYAERAANMRDSTESDKNQFENFKRIADEQKDRFINEKGLFALEVTPIAIAYKA